PSDLEWADAWTLLVAGDLHSSGAILQVDAATGQSRTLAGDGVFSSLSVAEDGTVYALRSDVGTPPRPVRIAADGSVTELPAPGAVGALPRSEERRVGKEWRDRGAPQRKTRHERSSSDEGV